MAEEVYDFMKYDLYFGNKEESVTNKYKLIVYVINDSEGGATGGGNYPVGELAIRPHHSGNPNMVYHEVSHSFQYLALWDSGIKDAWFPGPIFEMTSQWTLLRRSPEWIDQNLIILRIILVARIDHWGIMTMHTITRICLSIGRISMEWKS